MLQLASHTPLIVSALCPVELRSVLVRLQRGAYMTAADVGLIDGRIEAALHHVEMQQIDDRILTDAITLVRRHGLRTLESIQLACAIAARRRIGVPIQFIAADHNLLEAAAAEEFDVLDPCK